MPVYRLRNMNKVSTKDYEKISKYKDQEIKIKKSVILKLPPFQ